MFGPREPALLVHVDYLVVGSGLTGAIIARELADAGREVLVLERRSHLGGNVHDHVHESGVVVHTYGPHYFRTSSDRIWDYVQRFASFRRFEAVVMTLVDGKHEPWPIRRSYVRRVLGSESVDFTGTPANFEEACLARMPRAAYERFVRDYSTKQWGVPPSRLSPALAERVDVRSDDDPRFKQSKHQGLPRGGYAAFMRNVLEGITVVTGHDHLKERDAHAARRLLVFTGPIDEFFGFDMGRLPYRGQKREHEHVRDRQLVLPCGQVNNPAHEGGPHVRTLEWKHMMDPAEAKATRGTLLTRETPFSPVDPAEYEYPFPEEHAAELYARYRSRADALENVLICGRLGDYRYYDMDQAIGRALRLSEQILAKNP
jgi:UDP-galactopyranose mutase